MPSVRILRDGQYGQTYKYVSMPSLTRLERAINNLGMSVEIDQFGVPTWSRIHRDDCHGCDYCSDRWTS